MATEVPPPAHPLPALRAPRWAQALVALVFLASLGVFSVMTVFGHGATRQVSNGEKRTLAPVPGWPRDLASFEAFPARCEAWANDHLWLRGWLVGINSFLQLRLLDHSTRNDIIIGKQGWLYYNIGFTMDDYRGAYRFNQAQLDFMRTFLYVRSSWFARHHVAYVFVVAPDKHTVYPEYLPDRFRRKLRSGTSLDQFLAAAKLGGAVAQPLPILDLRTVLLPAARQNRLYQRTDTHWNEMGARIGSRTVRAWMQDQRPDRYLPEISTGAPISSVSDGGDLAAALGLQRVLRERLPHWPVSPDVLQPPWESEGLEAWQPYSALYTRDDTNEEKAADLRAIMIHDSFGQYMKPSLAEACHEVLFLGRPATMHYASFELMRRLIDGFKPDVVVEEVLERNLAAYFFDDPDMGPETIHYMQDP